MVQKVQVFCLPHVICFMNLVYSLLRISEIRSNQGTEVGLGLSNKLAVSISYIIGIFAKRVEIYNLSEI